jgi:hypothetical protein
LLTVLQVGEGFVFALFCATLCGQEPECVRWYRRCHVIHAVYMYSSNSVPTADGAERESVVAAKRTKLGTDDDSVAKLLLDPRLTSCHGSLVSSHIMGQVVTMLSGCCEQKYCPAGAPYSVVENQVILAAEVSDDAAFVLANAWDELEEDSSSDEDDGGQDADDLTPIDESDHDSDEGDRHEQNGEQ